MMPEHQQSAIRIEVLALCEHALTEPSGKVSAIGMFDTLFVKALPAVRAMVYVVLRYRIFESGTLQLKILQPDGSVRLEGKAHPHEFKGEHDSSDGALGQGVWSIGQLVFETEGRHSLRAYFDNREVAQLPLFVRIQENDTVGTSP